MPVQKSLEIIIEGSSYHARDSNFYKIKLCMKLCAQLNNLYNKAMMSRCLDYCLDVSSAGQLI